MHFSEEDINQQGVELPFTAVIIMRLAIKFNESQNFMFAELVPQKSTGAEIVIH